MNTDHVESLDDWAKREVLQYMPTNRWSFEKYSLNEYNIMGAMIAK